MLKKYRNIFSLKGTIPFTIAGMLGRIGYALLGLGITTSINTLYDNKSLASTVSSVFIICYAILNPLISHFIDLYGQKIILRIFTFISPLGLLLLTVAIHSHFPAYSLYLFAILASLLPNVPAITRARWTALLENNKEEINTAYSFETVLDEASFVIGPSLAIILNAKFSPITSLVTSIIFMTISLLALLLFKQTHPVLELPQKGQTIKFVFRYPGVALIFLIIFLIGFISAAVDTACVFIAEDNGNPSAGSIPVAIYALVSCISGFFYGVTRIKLTKEKQLLYCALGVGITALPMQFIHNINGVTIAVIFSGLFFAPTIIVTSRMIEERVPAVQITQALSMLNASMTIGVSLGGAITGIIAQNKGVHFCMLDATIAGIVIIIAISLGYSKLANYQTKTPIFLPNQ